MVWQRWIYAIPAHLRAFTRLRHYDQDIDDELSFHVAMLAESNVDRGMDRASATRQAKRAVGSLELVKEHMRDVQLTRWVRDFGSDLRYGFRALRRAPGFTLVVIATMALGIGANTAIFSVLSAVLLRPLPYPDAERLVRVWSTTAGDRVSTSLPDYRAWREGNSSFAAIGAYTRGANNVTGADYPEYLQTTIMTASTWNVLQVPPLLGRVFTEADEQWGRHRVVVISERYWARRFGRDPSAVGGPIILTGQQYTVVGVMPSSFQFATSDTELWTPMAFPPGSPMDTRRNRFSDVLGRLNEATPLDRARDDLGAIASNVARTEAAFNTGFGVALESWHESIVGSLRPTLLLLLGAVGFVLLIACANVANLLLARATTREQEMTVRVTLGAGRGRLVRQMLAESLLLASFGAAAGIALAYVLIRQIPALGPTGVPRLEGVWIDGTVMLFAMAITLLTGVLVGLWPSRRAGRAAAIGQTQTSARTVAGARMRRRSRHALVVAEVSLSLVLLIGAALLILSLQRLQRVDPGFNPDQLFTAAVTRFRPDGRHEFVHNVVDRIAATPGILSAAATTSLPLSESGWTKQFSVDGRAAPASIADVPSVNYFHVTPDYFTTMGASLRRGRTFTARDTADQPLVAVINETLARRFWSGGDPVGQHISMFPPESLASHLLPLRNGATTFPRLTIVGVIGDFRQNGLDHDANAEVYVPLAQGVQAGGGDDLLPAHFIVARVTGNPLAATTSIQSSLKEIDRNVPLSNVRSMDQRLADSLAQRRFSTLLLTLFAGVALVLSLVGLYGVMAYTAGQRRQELGVRAALGASAGESLRLVLGDGLRMAGLGVLIGLLLAAGLTQLMSTQLFAIRATDPAVYIGVALLLLVVSALACAVPAIRATRVNPATALRCE